MTPPRCVSTRAGSRSSACASSCPPLELTASPFPGFSVSWRRPSKATKNSPATGFARQYATAKRVRQELREARVYERRLDGGGTLLTEPILVLHREHRAGFAIFDQEGNPLGLAIRVPGLISGRSGSAAISEVRDTVGKPVLTIRMTVRRRWRKHPPGKTGTYAICSPDGTRIANIASSGAVTTGDDRVAHLDVSRRVTIDDADGRQIAHITRSAGWYVVQYTAAVDEPLRSLVLATSIVWDDKRPESER
jgi:hypothetical protein